MLASKNCGETLSYSNLSSLLFVCTVLYRVVIPQNADGSNSVHYHMRKKLKSTYSGSTRSAETVIFHAIFHSRRIPGRKGVEVKCSS